MEVRTNHFLKFVPFSKFDLWDTKRYTYQNDMNFDNVVRLSEILISYKKSVSKEEMIKNNYQIIAKINFGGELFLREKSEIETYKGGLFLVPSNSIIYSKINVRHGCIYYNDENSMPFGVSSEYPVFIFDPKRVNGYFLQKLLRTDAFKKLLNTKSTGISKARVKQDEFLDIQIPLPILQEQQEIVKAYFSKINEANQLEVEANNIDEEIEKYFLNQLGIEDSRGTINRSDSILNFISFSRLEKWSLNHLNRNSSISFENSNFKCEKIKNLLNFFEGGKTPSKSNKSFWVEEVNWTSPKDFTNVIFLERSEDKISQKAVIEAGMKIYPEDTFLSVFRSGILKHSFPTVLTKIPTTINQDLKAYSLDCNKILNIYYLYFVNTFPKYILENASKKSVTVESINTDEFLNVEIPLPPIIKQKEIIAKIEELKSKIEFKHILSKELKRQANEEFEKAIFQ